MSGYGLGIDLGTTWTAAAVGRDGVVQVAALGARSAAVPSVVWIGADGAAHVGDAALRRAAEDPERIAREFKRRVGDPAPIILGGAPWAAEALMGRVLRWVVDAVSAEQGGPPGAVALTHPASWGPYKTDLLEQAARQVGVGPVSLVAEPVAAATWYASQHRVEDGSVIAVYDLGGGTFDAAVVQRSAGTFRILGQPEGIERLGGIDFDAAIFAAVDANLGGALAGLDAADKQVQSDVAALRVACTIAKEALSTDSSAMVEVRLPNVRTTVRITRNEFEDMIRGPLGESVAALRRAIASADLVPSQLSAVLLVGGSSRIPLVSHLVSAELGVPLAVDANPKFAVASGAALAATLPAAVPIPPVPPPVAPLAEPSPIPLPPLPPPTGRRLPVPALVVGLAVLAIAALAAIVLSSGGGGGDEDDVASSDTTEASESTTTDEPTTTSAPSTTTTTTAAPTSTTTAGLSEYRLEVVAIDNGFNGIPNFTPPGRVEFDMRNEGEEEHELLVVPNDGSYDIRDAPEADLRARALVFDEGEMSAGPTGIDTGTLDLPEQDYFVVCLLPSAEFPGLDHRTLGMFRVMNARAP